MKSFVFQCHTKPVMCITKIWIRKFSSELGMLAQNTVACEMSVKVVFLNKKNMLSDSLCCF